MSRRWHVMVFITFPQCDVISAAHFPRRHDEGGHRRGAITRCRDFGKCALELVKARQLIVKGNSIDSRPRRRLEAGAARLPWDVRLRRNELDITRHCCRRLRFVLPELRASSGI